MKRSVFACLAAALAAASLRAGPAESAIVAAMKLPDASNYSWTTAIDDDARSYEISGKTDKATDLSLVNMPMVSSLNRRIARTGANADNQTTLLFKGDENFVIQVNDAWKKPDELPDASNSRYGSRGGYGGGYGGYGGWGGMGGGRGRRGMGGMGGIGGGFPTENGESSGPNGRPMPAYSNLQKTLSRPHEEVAIIVAGYSDLKADGDIISGTLSETSAKLLLVHPGQKEITPLDASGTFRLWVKDGVLQKYEVKLDGTLAVTINGERREVPVHQTALTTLKDVGATSFMVPDAAAKKLGITLQAEPAPKTPAT